MNETITTTALKPCPNPWCESHQYGPLGYPDKDDFEFKDNWVRVSCHNCGTTAHMGRNEAEAAANWNDRPGKAETIATLVEALELADATLRGANMDRAYVEVKVAAALAKVKGEVK